MAQGPVRDPVANSPRPGRLVLVCGPSGVGKGTVITELRRRHPSFGLSVSWTTRPRRAGEVEGEHYRFVDDDTFRTALANDEFIESEEYREHRYGTPWSEVSRALQAGDDLFLEVDIRGAKSIKQRFPHAVSIFICPPSLEALGERLRARGTDTPEQIHARLETARQEMAQRDSCDHAVLNDEVIRAVEEIEAILGLPRKIP